MLSQKIKGKNFTHLYFPIAKLSKDESIFSDPEKGIFKEKFKPVMTSIIGRQLAVNTYYANDLIALASTRITIDLLKIFDELKINFKINLDDITREERNHALDLAMTEIIKAKRTFLENIKSEDVPEIQSSVKTFITNTIENHKLDFFKDHFDELQGYLEMANSVITSDEKYIGTVVAMKRVIENEQRIFNLPGDGIGETIEHVIKTTLLSLMIAREIDDFDKKSYEVLSIICMGHDGGKALIPEEILYKQGRLTQLENDIMKSHVLLSFILASNNQENLSFESLAMALHHIKEDKDLPQSYGISKDTHTSFYEYLTPEAQKKLDETYHLMEKFYRVISIADTFEAITAERIYKKASSIGKALKIMINDNKKKCFFHPPYLDAFIKFIINKYLPKNLVFKINDELLESFFQADELTPENKDKYKKEFMGVILNSSPTLKNNLDCIIYKKSNQQIDRNLAIPPSFFLNHLYLK